MLSESFRPCVLIPTYNNPNTLRKVVEEVRALGLPVVVIDDASATEGRQVAAELASQGIAHVLHRKKNGGKGAAVKSGFHFTSELGFTHAVQVDADGQHNVSDITRFLEAAKQAPDALILGQPLFDASAPWGRRFARKISVFWTWLEVGGGAVGDPLCGFRAYPVASALRADARGNRMDFDPEIAVRMAWLGVPIVHLSTSVRYFSAAEGGVSHFAPWKDNWLISKMHTRLMLEKILIRWPVASLRFARTKLGIRVLPHA